MGLGDGDGPEQARPESIGADTLPQAERNAIDYNNEIADREVGRARRFLPPQEEARLKEREREKEHAFNALLHALQDPEYAKLYHEADDTVSRAQLAADRALEKLSREAAIASDDLENIRDAAAELPDGRKVFRGQDGRLYAEDGSDVTEHTQSVAGLTENAPSWEEYRRARERLEDLERRRQDVERYRQDVLAPARQRLEDRENPPSQDDLHDIIHTTEEAMPPDVRPGFEAEAEIGASPTKPARNSAAEEYVGSANLNTPELLIDFSTARDGVASAPVGPSPDVGPKVA